MSDDESIDCPGCGATAGDRQKNRPDDYQGIHECSHCGAGKCCMCDMCDDVECISCDSDDDTGG